MKILNGWVDVNIAMIDANTKINIRSFDDVPFIMILHYL